MSNPRDEMEMGPREWGPNEDPPERSFEVAGLRIKVKRKGQEPWHKQDGYEVVVRAPDDQKYRYDDYLPFKARYDHTGLFSAALAALLDIEFIQTDPDNYEKLYQGRGYHPRDASVVRQAAEKESKSFPPESVARAIEFFSSELRKLPTVQRGIKRGWEDLMKRRERGSQDA